MLQMLMRILLQILLQMLLRMLLRKLLQMLLLQMLLPILFASEGTCSNEARLTMLDPGLLQMRILCRRHKAS